jgi:cell division inhibitor SepF
VIDAVTDDVPSRFRFRTAFRRQFSIDAETMFAITATYLAVAQETSYRGSGEPRRLEPRSFDDAQIIADAFKTGRPVLVNLYGVDSDLARRLVDFASGVCYALGGTMERVDVGLYLLTPRHVEVPAAEEEAQVVEAVREQLDGILWAPVPKSGSEGEAWRRAKPPTTTR